MYDTPGAPNVQPPNVQHCPQCATFFWGICVLPRVPNVQQSGKILTPKWQKWTEMG